MGPDQEEWKIPTKQMNSRTDAYVSMPDFRAGGLPAFRFDRNLESGLIGSEFTLTGLILTGTGFIYPQRPTHKITSVNAPESLMIQSSSLPSSKVEHTTDYDSSIPLPIRYFAAVREVHPASAYLPDDR